MNTNENGQPCDDDWLPRCFFENRQNYPPEQLLQYAGKHIAWSWDGTRIVASADDLTELYRRLEEAGIPLNRAVPCYVDSLDSNGESISVWFDDDESAA